MKQILFPQAVTEILFHNKNIIDPKKTNENTEFEKSISVEGK